MKRIGLTGNIGSGKSLVSEIFKVLEVPVFNADIEAKKILDAQHIISQLVNIFGEEIVKDNCVDRTILASAVFNNPAQLQKLNNIIHPEVRNHFINWSAGMSDCKYVIYEAAIIFESGFYTQLERTILVTAPKEIRIERVMKRDKATRAQVEARVKNQWTEESKRKFANYIISNNGQEMLLPQVLEIHTQIVKS